MKVWLPYIIGGSGVDVFTQLLARGLQAHGAETVAQPIPHAFQYAPTLLRALRAPEKTDIIITNSWNGFAFRRRASKLIVVEHHCIFDPAYLPYRSRAQGVFHDTMVKRFERASFAAADRVVAVSRYTADSTAQVFPGVTPEIIHNGVDTQFFCPSPKQATTKKPDQPFRLFFVGNMTRRKGADLLAPIMEKLGPGFELTYTGGLRTDPNATRAPNMHPTGRLSNAQLREAYRDADALLFPTRLEGFGYAAAEAMACGLPVVTTRGSSLTEIVRHGSTGFLCQQDNTPDFADAIRTLAKSPALCHKMSAAGRRRAVECFDIQRTLYSYTTLCDALISHGAKTT